MTSEGGSTPDRCVLERPIQRCHSPLTVAAWQNVAMSMVIDPDAAAYGIFQIAFATMDTRLSRSLVALCRRKNDRFTFAILRRMPLGRRLATLRKAIKTAPRHMQSDPEIQELKKACDLAEGIQEWRNGRIHAEVRFQESQPVLVDGNGRPLEINREACEQKFARRSGPGLRWRQPFRTLSRTNWILKNWPTRRNAQEAGYRSSGRRPVCLAISDRATGPNSSLSW